MFMGITTISTSKSNAIIFNENAHLNRTSKVFGTAKKILFEKYCKLKNNKKDDYKNKSSLEKNRKNEFPFKFRIAQKAIFYFSILERCIL